MITTKEQFEITLKQIASFKGMQEAMRRHLEETEPSLIPLALEGYKEQIATLQTEVCDYLLRERQPTNQVAA
jgi:hypothetical protein